MHLQSHRIRTARRLRAAGVNLGLFAAFFLSFALTEPCAKVSAAETDGAPLDMSWILGISLGDSADDAGFKDANWYEDDDCRFYICPLGSRPTGYLLEKGWTIEKAYATPTTKRICVMLAPWSPGLEWGIDRPTTMEALVKRYGAKDENDLGCILFREKHGELLAAMKERFGMEPIEDRMDIAKAIPANLGGFFPRPHTLLDEKIVGHVHLFRRGNRMVFLACSDTIRDEDSKLSLSFVVLDTDLLREATREANQLRQALGVNKPSSSDD